MDDNSLRRKRGKDLSPDAGAALPVGCGHNSPGQVKRMLIAGYLAGHPAEIQIKVAEWLISLIQSPYPLPLHDFPGKVVASFMQQHTQRVQKRIDMDVFRGLRFPAVEGILIELYPFDVRPAEHHRPMPSVPDRQCLFPYSCRGRITETEVFRLRHARQQQHQCREVKYSSHIILNSVSLYQVKDMVLSSYSRQCQDSNVS